MEFRNGVDNRHGVGDADAWGFGHGIGDADAFGVDISSGRDVCIDIGWARATHHRKDLVEAVKRSTGTSTRMR